MGWIASFGIALLTSMASLLGAGTVAGLAVDWYDISSFEGGAGFFVVGMALFGAMGGFIIGLVVSRIEARHTPRRFVRAFGISVGTVAAILAAITAGSWMLADIPPRIDGEELFLRVEIRWPASGAVAPAALSDTRHLQLGALAGSTVRKQERGPLFLEDARQEDGRWVVPGAVPIFTSRGGRLLYFGTRDQSLAGFIVPLPRYPGEAQRQWSAWLSAARPGEAPADQFSYRFKVITRSEPVRTESVGPFDIDTIADSFHSVGDSDRLAARATFRVRYKGDPLPAMAVVESVAVIGGPVPALFVSGETSGEVGCVLIVDEGPAPRVIEVEGCNSPVTERPLTSDQARFTAAKEQERLPGWIDRVAFAEPGLFQVDTSIIDTRNLTTTRFNFPSDAHPDVSVPVLDLSPDENNFVWLAVGSDSEPRLGVTNWRTSQSYLLPIDRARMRYSTESALDPTWVHHHFAWQRGNDGIERLVERPDFVPLPYRGEVTLGKPGEYQGYSLHPGGDPLGDAVVEILIRDLAGERLPDEPAGFHHVRVQGCIVTVAVIGSPSYVHVSIDSKDCDPQIMPTISTALDAALATGRYDALFVAREESR